eukprot:scaffold37209_cov24-Phaeocystis_antarctica.AAC.1
MAPAHGKPPPSPSPSPRTTHHSPLTAHRSSLTFHPTLTLILTLTRASSCTTSSGSSARRS